MRETWDAVKASSGKKVISDSPADYQKTADGKTQVSRQRRAAAIEWALAPFVEGWPIPNIEVDRRYTRAEDIETARSMDFVRSRLQYAGLHWHRTQKFDHVFNDIPDDALERAFKLLDDNPDCPAALIYVDQPGNHSMGPRLPTDPTESVVALVLARRERVEWLRRFIPYVDKGEGNNPEFWKWTGTPPVPFTPTRCFPTPWTKGQFAQFDKLPTMAVLHRPVVVSYRKDGGTAMSDREREAVFAAGWARALDVLPKNAEGKLHPRAIPARVFYDHGDASGARNLVPATVNLLHNPDPQALRLDVLDPQLGFNMFNVLGDTGIASPMVQWAIGSIATWTEKDVTITLNLRNPDQATITVITPNNRPDNLGRSHPAGNPADFPLRSQQ